MPQSLRFELAGDHFFTNPVEQGKNGGLAIASQQLGERRGQRRLGHNLRFDASTDAVRPGFVVALDGSEALFLTYQCIQFAGARLDTQLCHPFMLLAPDRRNLSNRLNVPLTHVTQPARRAAPTFVKKLTVS